MSNAKNSTRIYVEQIENGNYTAKFGGSSSQIVEAPTQALTIQVAQSFYPDATIEVERVRNTSVGGRDQWRKP